MDNNRRPNSWIDRMNRRGCFILAAGILLLLAALAYIGFHGEPIDQFRSAIPTVG